jgi:alpha-glucosidase
MFAFDLMLTPWHKESVEWALNDIVDVLHDTGVAPAWTLNNHDTQRIVTRLGRPDAEDPNSWTGNNFGGLGTGVDLLLGTRRARALTALAFALPGSLYLYQGEELGLPEVFDIPDDRRQDPVFHLTFGSGVGRDGCRIPLPWTEDPATSFGFSSPVSGEIERPWLPQPDDWGTYAASTQHHAGSMFDLYRQLSAARRRDAVVERLGAEVLELGPGLVGFRRGALVVVMNVSGHDRRLGPEAGLDGCRIVVDTAPGAPTDVVAANATKWFRRD